MTTPELIGPDAQLKKCNEMSVSSDWFEQQQDHINVNSNNRVGEPDRSLKHLREFYYANSYDLGLVGVSTLLIVFIIAMIILMTIEGFSATKFIVMLLSAAAFGLALWKSRLIPYLIKKRKNELKTTKDYCEKARHDGYLVNNEMIVS